MFILKRGIPQVRLNLLSKPFQHGYPPSLRIPKRNGRPNFCDVREPWYRKCPSLYSKKIHQPPSYQVSYPIKSIGGVMKIKHAAAYGALTAWMWMFIVASGAAHVGATRPIIAEKPNTTSRMWHAQPSPGTTLRIDAGSATNYIDVAGNLWVADTGYVGGHARGRYTVPISGTPDDRIYQTERYAMSAYVLPVDNGRYTVRLHFAEDNRNLGGIGLRVFGVKVEDLSLPTVDVFAEAGALYTALIRSVDVTVSDQQLDIQFISMVNNPQIKGIEVLPLGGAPNPTSTPTQTSSPTASATSTQTPSPTASATPTGTPVPAPPAAP